jgi:hypothetical protein
MNVVGNGDIAPPFLTFVLDGGEWSASLPSLFTARERAPGTYWIGGWVDPRASLIAVAKRKISCPCQESNCPTHSLSLYWVSYPSSDVVSQDNFLIPQAKIPYDSVIILMWLNFLKTNGLYKIDMINKWFHYFNKIYFKEEWTRSATNGYNYHSL